MSKPASIAADLQSTLGPGHAPARPASVSLHQVDLNLFRVFEAVMKHRSITCASRDLYLTPSAVSHALSRLRAVLSDKLFIAGETGMEPTARALELAPHVRGGLARIDAALTGQTVAPVNVRRTFPIAASDYGAQTVLPQLAARLGGSALRADLRVFPVSRPDTLRQPDEGRSDMPIGWLVQGARRPHGYSAGWLSASFASRQHLPAG